MSRVGDRSRVCAKCKKGPPRTEDTWCRLCCGVEVLSGIAKEQWSSPAFRQAAEDQVEDVVRHVRTLLVLDRRTKGAIDSYCNRRQHPWHQKEKEGEVTTTPKASARPPAEDKKEEAKKEDKREEIQEEVKEEEGAGRRSSGSKDKPPEPEGPPPGQEKARSRSRRRGRRAGTKHQQKFRALENPDLAFHSRSKGSDIPLERRRR